MEFGGGTKIQMGEGRVRGGIVLESTRDEVGRGFYGYSAGELIMRLVDYSWSNGGRSDASVVSLSVSLTGVYLLTYNQCVYMQE